MLKNSAIFIPARMASTRFPNKPLALIHGKPMIIHVLERSLESGVDDVYVACSEQEVADVVKKYNGRPIMTDPDLPSGTDRIFAAMQASGREYENIVNVQGDLPSLDPSLIKISLDILANRDVDMSTLAAVIHDEEEKTNPNVVKAVISFTDDSNVGRALYFTRATAPYGDGDLYHHIGLYAYRADSLKRFVSLPPSPLEKRERLEQLRALENGMRVDVGVVNAVPLGVDTPEDLAKVELSLAG